MTYDFAQVLLVLLLIVSFLLSARSFGRDNHDAGLLWLVCFLGCAIGLVLLPAAALGAQAIDGLKVGL